MLRLLSFLLLIVALPSMVHAQSRYYIRADSVYIEKGGGNGELIIRNATRDSVGGIMVNMGGGRTAFLKSKKLNDSSIVIGKDTLIIGGSGAIASIKSAGNGFSLVIPPDTIRSVRPFGNWISGDTTTVRGELRLIITPQAGDGLLVDPFTDAIKRDTTRGTGIPTYYYLDSLANVEDSLVIVNQGDGENISYVRNDSIFFKKIIGTGAATVTTAGDSTLVIDVDAPSSSLTATQVAYGSGTNEMTSEQAFNYTAASNALHADSMLTIRTRADSLFANHRIGIGTTQPQFFLHSVGSNPAIGIVDTRVLSSTNGASMLLYNQGTPNAAGQRLGQFLFGSNPTGTTFRNSAAVAAYSSGSWTDGSSHPTDISFEITQSGSSSRVEVARLKSTGQLGIGTSAPHMRLTLAGSSSSATQTGVEAYQYGGPLGGVFVGLHSRGTEASPTATQANDTIARFGGAGYGTSQTAPYTTGTVQVIAEENFTNTSMPTGMLFQTTPTGSNVRLNRMYIRANGNVSIGTTSATANVAARKLYITGSIGVSKDSVPIVSTTASDYALVIDTADDQIKRRYRPKIYTAIISQSGTSNPVATVLQPNSIGTIVWTRNSAGNYTGTLTGAFPASKTWLVASSSSLGFPAVTLTRVDNNSITLITYNESGGVLIADDDFDFMSIEIRIYQ